MSISIINHQVIQIIQNKKIMNTSSESNKLYLESDEESEETCQNKTNNQTSTEKVVTRKSFELDATGNDIDSSFEEIEEERVKNKRGPNKVYEEIQRYDNYDAALEDMKKKSYHHRYNRHTSEGNKQYYSCNGFEKCPKLMYILLVSNCIYI